MIGRILRCLAPYLRQAGFHRLPLQSADHGQKLIPSVASHKMLRRHSPAQLHRKGTDIFVSLLMAEIIVDDTQIV